MSKTIKQVSTSYKQIQEHLFVNFDCNWTKPLPPVKIYKILYILEMLFWPAYLMVFAQVVIEMFVWKWLQQTEVSKICKKTGSIKTNCVFNWKHLNGHTV